MSIRFATRLIGLLVLLLPHRAPAQGVPRFTLTRDLRIDAHAADLSAVSWLTVSRTGMIAVGQNQDHLIRFFDAAGGSLGTFGRDGAGPGEFRRMDIAGWLGDTMWVEDGAALRFTLISPNRKILRNVPMAIAIKAPGDTAGGVQVIGAAGLYSDGSQLLEVIVSSDAAKRPAWAHDDQHTDSRLVLVTVTAKSEFKRLVSFGQRDDCGMVRAPGYDFCGHLKIGIDPAVQYLAWATGSVAGADSGTYRITLFRPDGGVTYSRKYPYVAQPIPARLRDSVAERARTERPSGAPASMLPKIGPPRVYPPVESVIVGDDGTAWVQLRTVPGGNPWVMLSPRGEVIGTLVAPVNVRLMFLGASTVWGTEKDADDVESVVRFRVVRSQDR